MPIAGVVISTYPQDVITACEQLADFAGVEIHGSDELGNIVAVFYTATPEAMEDLLQQVNSCPLVLHAGITYLNMENIGEGEVDQAFPQCPNSQREEE